jgi:hypothetical protein
MCRAPIRIQFQPALHQTLVMHPTRPAAQLWLLQQRRAERLSALSNGNRAHCRMSYLKPVS